MRFPNRLNTTDLQAAVRRESGVKAADVQRVFAALGDVIARELAAGRSIAWTNVGTWLPVDRPARYARHPQTGDRYLIPAKHAATWRASTRLAEIVADRDTEATTRKRTKQPGRNN